MAWQGETASQSLVGSADGLADLFSVITGVKNEGGLERAVTCTMWFSRMYEFPVSPKNSVKSMELEPSCWSSSQED